jgi:hypothetical protein
MVPTLRADVRLFQVRAGMLQLLLLLLLLLVVVVLLLVARPRRLMYSMVVCVCVTICSGNDEVLCSLLQSTAALQPQGDS